MTAQNATWLCAMLLLALLSTSSSHGYNNSDNQVVTIDTSRVMEPNFVGFGVQWEYEGDRRDLNIDCPVWSDRWPEMLKRIDYMHPSILRVMHNASMYTRLDGNEIIPDYESPRMEVMYRILDYAKSRNIPVILGEWWLPQAYFGPLGGISSPRWSDNVIVPFLVHLRQRGYTNIKYFNLINEPAPREISPGVQFDYDTWRAIILNLSAALKRNGLEHEIKIVGTDGPGDWDGWIEKVSKDAALRTSIQAYEYHLYAHLKTDKWLPSLLEGKLGDGELAPRRQMISRNDPGGSKKPFFMGETGIDDGSTGDNQIHRTEFAYGVWMADYAVQSMRAGQSGLIAWDMDDAMHDGGSYGAAGLKGWGFWNSLAGVKGYPDGDFKPRPWFFTWSLLCRLFPQGAQTIQVSDEGVPACRVAAALLPDNKGLSLAIVNESTDPKDVTLVVPTANRITMHEYRYFADDRLVTDEGFPVAKDSLNNIDLSQGLTVHLPGQGVIFMTTQDFSNQLAH